MHERLRADDTRAERPVHSWAAPLQRYEAQRVLALQATAGNAAVARMLGSRRARAEEQLQRAPLHAVMGAHETFFYGNAEALGYTTRRADLPDGYHVTIYPDNLTPDQQTSGLAETALGEIEGYEAITFNQFNVTRDSDDKHFYFNELGHAVWKGTNREANFHDRGWDDAVKAAAVIYGLIGVAATEATIHADLFARGRTLSKPKPAKPAVTTPVAGQGGPKKKAGFRPRALVVPQTASGAGAKPPVKRTAPRDLSVEPPQKKLKETTEQEPDTMLTGDNV